MTSPDKSAAVLQAHILAGADVLRRIETHLDAFLTHDPNAQNKSTTGAIVIADALSRHYTAAETVFFGLPVFSKIPSKATAGMSNCWIAWPWPFQGCDPRLSRAGHKRPCVN